jgi:hypothetical protein
MQWHFKGAVKEETAPAVAFYPSPRLVPGHRNGLQLLWLCKCQIGKWNIPFYDVMTRQNTTPYTGSINFSRLTASSPTPAVPALHIIFMAGTDSFPRSPIASFLPLQNPGPTPLHFHRIILHVKLELHHLPCHAAYLVP